MHLSKSIPLLSQDGPAMMKLGRRIAARRRAESMMLPAPEGWQRPRRLKLNPVKIFMGVIILIHLALAAFTLTQP